MSDKAIPLMTPLPIDVTGDCSSWFTDFPKKLITHDPHVIFMFRRAVGVDQETTAESPRHMASRTGIIDRHNLPKPAIL